MKTYSKRSTNGRWGIQVLHPEGINMETPQEGTLTSLGTSAGMTCFKFEPGQTGTWVIAGDDMNPVAGCEAVVHMDLQSSDYVSILVCRNFAVWKEYSYKRRSAQFWMLKDGKANYAETAILLDAGIVKPAQAPEKVPEPAPFDNAFEAALRKAGLV